MQNRSLNFAHFTADSEEGRLLFEKIQQLQKNSQESQLDPFFIAAEPDFIEKDIGRMTWKIHGQVCRLKTVDELIGKLTESAENKEKETQAKNIRRILHNAYDQSSVLGTFSKFLMTHVLGDGGYGFLPSFSSDAERNNTIVELKYEGQAPHYKVIYPAFCLKLFKTDGDDTCVCTLYGPVTITYKALPEEGGVRFVEADILSPIIQKLLEEAFMGEEKKESSQIDNSFTLKKLEQLIQKVPLAELYYTLYSQEIDKVLPEEKKIDHKYLIEKFLPNKDKYLKIRASILELKLKITDEIIKINAKAQELEEEAKSMPVKMHAETISIHEKDKLEKIQSEFAKKQVELNTDAKILNDIASDFSKAANDFFQKLATEPESAAKKFQETCRSLTKYGPSALVPGRDYGPKDYRKFSERHRSWWTPTIKNILLCATLVGLLIFGIRNYVKTGHLFFKRDSVMQIENTGKRMREEADELAKLVSSKKLKR